MTCTESASSADLERLGREAREKLDAHVREIVQWHFHESTGCPFWLAKKAELKFDPLREVQGYQDLAKFPPFEDEWLRGGPVRRWVPKSLPGSADLCVRNRRHDRDSEVARRD